MKVLILDYAATINEQMYIGIAILDTSGNPIDEQNLPLGVFALTSLQDLASAAQAAVLLYAQQMSYSITASDILNLPSVVSESRNMDISTTLVEKAYDAHRDLFLPVSEDITMPKMGVYNVFSPYFQRSSLQEIGTGRNIHLFLAPMDYFIDSVGVSGGNPYVVFSWWDNTNAFQSSDIAFMTWANVKANGLSATLTAALNTYASGHSLTVNSISNIPGVLPNSPQSAITDCPADAITNYNVVTTLLGALTGAVNTANTKQNDIATQLNSLLAELRTLGLITP